MKNTKTFEKIGNIAGVGYGLYFAYSRNLKAVDYLFWVIIFGLSFHEIGEQVDRTITKIKEADGSK